MQNKIRDMLNAYKSPVILVFIQLYLNRTTNLLYFFIPYKLNFPVVFLSKIYCSKKLNFS